MTSHSNDIEIYQPHIRKSPFVRHSSFLISVCQIPICWSSLHLCLVKSPIAIYIYIYNHPSIPIIFHSFHKKSVIFNGFITGKLHLPSGKRLHSCWKSPFLVGKSTISMAIFNRHGKLPEGNMLYTSMCLLRLKMLSICTQMYYLRMGNH